MVNPLISCQKSFKIVFLVVKHAAGGIAWEVKNNNEFNKYVWLPLSAVSERLVVVSRCPGCFKCKDEITKVFIDIGAPL